MVRSKVERWLLHAQIKNYQRVIEKAATALGVERWANEDLANWLERAIERPAPLAIKVRTRLLEDGPVANALRARRRGLVVPRPISEPAPKLINPWTDAARGLEDIDVIDERLDKRMRGRFA